jgi:iron(III) transport system permease protein
LRVSLPQARPAIAAGTAIVMMETLNDFGTVDYFAVQTLTTGIFSIWLESYDPGGAAQLALLAALIVAGLLGVEKIGRRRARFNKSGRQMAPIQPQPLSSGQGAAVLVYCLVPIFLGFLSPLLVLVAPVVSDFNLWHDPGLWRAAGHSLALGSLSAGLVVVLATVMVLGVRKISGAWKKSLLTLTTLGYAFPGAVLGLGILIPLAAFDNWLADLVFATFRLDPGLLLTGTAGALIIAYCVRFFAIGVGAAEAGLATISTNIPLAASTLGHAPRDVVLNIYQPLMRGSLASAMVLVFVDTVKELPATLLLRPFNFDTLSTHVYEQASLENFHGSTPAALLIITLSFGAIFLLAKAHR